MTGLIPLAPLVAVWLIGVFNRTTVVEIRRRPRAAAAADRKR